MYTENIKKRRVNISDLFDVKYNRRMGVVCDIWASVCDLGTYRVSEQRKLRRVCAYMHRLTRAFAACTQSIDVDDGSRPKFRPLAFLCMSAWAIIRGIFAHVINTQISCIGQ